MAFAVLTHAGTDASLAELELAERRWSQDSRQASEGRIARPGATFSAAARSTRERIPNLHKCPRGMDLDRGVEHLGNVVGSGRFAMGLCWPRSDRRGCERSRSQRTPGALRPY